MKCFLMNGKFTKRIINCTMRIYREIPWTNTASIKFGIQFTRLLNHGIRILQKYKQLD